MAKLDAALNQSEIKRRLKNLPHWQQRDGALSRTIEFPNYLDGVEFVNRLGCEAERMDHHPTIVLDYKKATVTYSTHSAGGITELDFKAAEMVDRLNKSL